MMAAVHQVDAVIEVAGLHKAYGSHEALRGLSLSVCRGEVYGLLGPNGAGKTTTVEILEGFRAPTSGSVSVLGMNPLDSFRKGRHHRSGLPAFRKWVPSLPRELPVGNCLFTRLG